VANDDIFCSGKDRSHLADATRVWQVFDDPKLMESMLNGSSMFDYLCGSYLPPDHGTDAGHGRRLHGKVVLESQRAT
jgi:hypothetical protein